MSCGGEGQLKQHAFVFRQYPGILPLVKQKMRDIETFFRILKQDIFVSSA
jgi:hypothetical protein